MRYQIVDDAQVPAPRSSASRAAEQKRLLTSKIVIDLRPDTVAAVTPERAKTVRSVKAALTRAGTREGRLLRVWDIDGTVYVALHGNAS